MIDHINYHGDVSNSPHDLKVVAHLYDESRPDLHGYGDFMCDFNGRSVIVDLISGSEFPDDFDYKSLVGKTVSVDHSHGYKYIASNAFVAK